MSKPKLRALFSRLNGGETQVRDILIDFYRRMSADVLIGHFFFGKDVDAVALKQVELVLFAMGARSQYVGKSPQTAHLGLPPILRGQFDRRLVLLRETLVDHGLNEKDIAAWVTFENAFRPAIISHSSN